MSSNNNIDAQFKKDTFCKYGCYTRIKFDNSQVSVRGRKIPLNLDGSLHDCPNSQFNKAKQLQRINNNDATRAIICKYCGQQIMFNDKVTSVRGRKIPLNIDGSNHNCPNNSFNQARRRNSDETKRSDL
jgi:DNA-directed RNA polymerase subunit RPC12/RpoP